MDEANLIRWIKKRKGKIEIFKYQTNLNTFDSTPRRSRVLIYNQDRSFMTEIDMTPDLEQNIFKGAWKIYVKSGVIPFENVIVPIKHVRSRSW